LLSAFHLLPFNKAKPTGKHPHVESRQPQTNVKFFGASAAGLLLEPLLRDKLFGIAPQVFADSSGHLSFPPVRLPHPLPIYKQQKSFLGTGLEMGTLLPASADTRLLSFTVIDDVVVPPEYERYVIVHWGDRVFPNRDDYVGYNADYTAFIAIGGDRDDDDHSRAGYLWVNHEYVSYPLSTLAPATVRGLANSPTTAESVLGFALPAGSNPMERRSICGSRDSLRQIGACYTASSTITSAARFC
jgi:uncharacterized protein